MRTSLFIFASLVLAAAPALAVTTQTPTEAVVSAKGQLLRSIDNSRLGRISRVASNGSVEVIVDTQVRVIPATTLSLVEGKLTTSMTKQQVVSLR